MPGLHSGLTSDDPRVLRAVMPDRIQNVVVREGVSHSIL
jgi:hypothetical protein